MSPRNPKTSMKQYEFLVQFIEEHPDLTFNKLSTSFTAKARNSLWEELSQCLNAMEKRPQKDIQKWQKTWTDLKHATRDKAARIRKSQMETNGKFEFQSIEEEFSPLQLKVLNLIGWNGSNDDVFAKEVKIKNDVSISSSDANFQEREESNYSDNDMLGNHEWRDEIYGHENGNAGSNVELFSITKYPETRRFHKKRKVTVTEEDNRNSTNELLEQQKKILEKISEHHERIADTEQFRMEENSISLTVLLQQQNKILEKIVKQHERINEVKQFKRDESNSTMNVLVQQQNKFLEKIAEHHQRIADAEHRKADTLEDLSNTIKALLNK